MTTGLGVFEGVGVGQGGECGFERREADPGRVVVREAQNLQEHARIDERMNLGYHEHGVDRSIHGESNSAKPA